MTVNSQILTETTQNKPVKTVYYWLIYWFFSLSDVIIKEFFPYIWIYQVSVNFLSAFFSFKKKEQWMMFFFSGGGLKQLLTLTRTLIISKKGLVWFVGFYDISTFVGYLTPNPFLCKKSVPFKTIQFSISTQFNCRKHFYFKLFKQLYVTIQLSVNTVSMSKNSSILNNSDKHKHTV